MIDTRDLIEKREELKQEILDSFLEEFEDYAHLTESFEDIRFDEEELDGWKLLWSEKINQTTCIDELEEQIEDYSEGSFKFGVTLIEEKDFEEYCEECDYTEVVYEGRTYLFRQLTTD